MDLLFQKLPTTKKYRCRKMTPGIPRLGCPLSQLRWRGLYVTQRRMLP